jgi:alpha-tubulin suppressor-like RCC1 family protein
MIPSDLTKPTGRTLNILSKFNRTISHQRKGRRWGFPGVVLASMIAVSASLAETLPTGVVGWGPWVSGPAVVPAGLTNVVQVSASVSHCAALRADGTVTVWGSNPWGPLEPPFALTNAIAIATGSYNTMAILADKSIVRWGSGAMAP